MVGRLVGWLLVGLVDLIEVHGSWLMAGKSLESIAALLREKLLVIVGAAGAGAAAAAATGHVNNRGTSELRVQTSTNNNKSIEFKG